MLMVAWLLNCPEARAGLPRSRSLGEGNSLCLGTAPFPLVSVKPAVKLSREQDWEAVWSVLLDSSVILWLPKCFSLLEVKPQIFCSLICLCFISAVSLKTLLFTQLGVTDNFFLGGGFCHSHLWFTSLALTWVKLHVFSAILSQIWLSKAPQQS